MPKIYKIVFTISLILTVVSLAVLLIYGLNFGTDFTGGSILEVEFLGVRPEASKIKELLNKFNLGQVSISATGERELILKMPEISEEKHQEILAELEKIVQNEAPTLQGVGAPTASVGEKRFDSIGSAIGQELKSKSIAAIVIALILISVYLAIVFNRIGKVITPWALAFGAIVALLHDLLLPIGVFVLLGKFKGVAIDAPLIAAALTILGYSINDTVVVYDRIRENVLKKPQEDFNSTVHKSIKQVLVRSINTTLTTLLAVIAIFIFGGATLKNFSLALIIGIASGAYSSIFIASPILMMFHKK